MSNSIRQPGVYSSALPADESRRFRRNAARFQKLDELARRVRLLEGGADGQGDTGDE